MIKVLTAYTEEIDDVEAAVSSLLEQLAPEKNLLKNSIALIHCYYEFIESGVVEELDKRLGIPTFGTTTMALGVPGYVGDMALSVTALTSDDIRFSSGVSDPASPGTIAKTVSDLYKKATAGFDEKPSLLFAFPPMLKEEGGGGDIFVSELEKASGGGIPLFGTLPITNQSNEMMSRVLYRGKDYDSSTVLAAFYGDVKPEFYTVAVTEKALNTKRAKITGVKLNVLESINDIPVERYLESLGLSVVSILKNMPIVIYEEDGSKVFRVGLSAQDDRSLLLTGIAPKNAEISFSSITNTDIVEATEQLMQSIIKNKNLENRGILIYVCCSRFWILGPQWREEPEMVASLIGNSIPWHFVYSGGEVFPSVLETGKVANHLQNYSVIVCVL
jgi:hypothetical protein